MPSTIDVSVFIETIVYFFHRKLFYYLNIIKIYYEITSKNVFQTCYNITLILKNNYNNISAVT